MANSDNHTGPGTCGSPCLPKFLLLSWLSPAYNNAAPPGLILVMARVMAGSYLATNVWQARCSANIVLQTYILPVSLYTPCYCINRSEYCSCPVTGNTISTTICLLQRLGDLAGYISISVAQNLKKKVSHVTGLILHDSKNCSNM